MKSRDVLGGNVAKIAALFPQCVTECRDMPTACGSGEASSLSNNTCQRHVPTVRYKIDWDKLRAELDPDLIQQGEERYQFTWPDKRAASRLANEATDKTLRPDLEASVDFWNTKNLYIEGDNLDVLKVLRENYLGAIKMIYIDPPYNTGNDFIYNDDFAQDYDAYRRDIALRCRDEEGRLIDDPMQRNTESNGRFHTDWLNMIYPRLKVARDLLSDDGVIFISIDDNEAKNLKSICDEVFGAQNFISQVVWERAFAPINLKKHFSVSHDYILCYSKNIELTQCNGLPRTEDTNNRYSNPDNDPRGPWQSDNSTVGPAIADKIYEIVSPSGKIFLPPNGRCWLYTKARFQEMIDDNRIWFGENGGNMPRVKRFLSEVKQGITPMSIWRHEEVGHSQDASQKLKKLFDGKSYFDYPKPVGLIKRCIQLYSNNDSTILDFFSGSATTAHAVMKLNAEDGGKRKFIMVQLPEVTDEQSEARKAGYANICEIGKERIRRAGKQILESLRRDMPPACSTRESLFKDETSQSDVPTLDVGFRVLKLDSSNMEDVFYTPEDFDAKDIFTSVDNVKPDRTPLDLLFQVLPELNIELSARIEEKEVNGKKVFFVDGNYLIATFDTEVNESTVTDIAKMKPQYFVMRDASAANDNVLDNFEQIFRHYSPETIRKIL